MNKPGLGTESFKLKLTKSDIIKDISDVDFVEIKIIGEPKIVYTDKFLLTSGEFNQTYDTYRGACIAVGKRKLLNYEISNFKEQGYQYEVKWI